MPDIKNKAEYTAYQQTVAQFIEEEGLSFLSTGTAEECGGPDGEPWFSWSPCEMCESHLGGNREYLYARDRQDEIVQFTICEDCVYYVNCGQLDDATMARVRATE